MKFDDVLKQIGEFGPYQRRVYCLAAAPAILLAFETLSVIFIFNIPDHRCAVPGLLGDTYRVVNDSHAAIVNLSIPFRDGQWDQCHVFSDVAASNLSHTNGDVGGNSSQSACNKWVFDHSTFDSTIATDFDVVCDRSMLRARSNMVSELGTLVGTLVCGFIADRFGRKITFYVAGLALAGGGFGIAFATNLLTLNVCRFILGIARMATWSNSFVIGMEIVGPSKRTFAGMAIEFVWCAGEALLLLMAYFVRNWRYLEIALSVPSIGLFFYWWLMPESPRWLASRGRDEEAVRILEKIAASNRTVLPKVEDAKQLLEGEPSISFRNIFRSRELVLRMLILFSNMFIIVMVYYGLTLNITNLSGNIYSNFAVNIAFEVLAYIAPYLLLDRVGRKPVYCASILLAGASCVMAVLPVLLAAPVWVVSALSMLGRFFVSVAFAVIYVYGAELFPTVIRTSTMGVGIAFARVGNMIAPYLADVGILVGGELQQALPLLLMGIPAVLAGLLSLWLPETLGVKMPETMMDVGKRNMNQKRRCCLTRNDDDYDDEEASSVNM